MNELELDLRQLLTERADTVSALPQMQRTVRRARVRRVANAGIATLAMVAIASVGVAAVEMFFRSEPRLGVATPGFTTEGPYGFTSVEGSHPTIASGQFRGADWRLAGTVSTEAGIDTVHLQLSITKDAKTVLDEQDVAASDDVLVTSHVQGAEILDGADVVYGSTVPGLDSVEVDIADGDGTLIRAHRFLDYDADTTITADYYIAFIPSDSPGFVHARDGLGIDIEVEEYGGVSLAPHVVASGSVAGAGWSLELAPTEPDRLCLVFSSAEVGSECLTRDQIESAGPLLMVTFPRDDVLGVVAIMSAEVGDVRLVREGHEPDVLPWFETGQGELRDWSFRLVAVGLDPATHGVLRADALRDQDEIIAEERF